MWTGAHSPRRADHDLLVQVARERVEAGTANIRALDVSITD